MPHIIRIESRVMCEGKELQVTDSKHVIIGTINYRVITLSDGLRYARCCEDSKVFRRYAELGGKPVLGNKKIVIVKASVARSQQMAVSASRPAGNEIMVRVLKPLKPQLGRWFKSLIPSWKHKLVM